MTRSVVTTDPGQSLQSARRLMHEGRFRHLPVIDDGRLVGILSDRDLASDERRSVAEAMHPQVIAVNPDTPVEMAAALMVDNKIGALPVVAPASDRLVGIVSQTDLFVVLARLLGGDGPSTRLELVLDDLPRQLAVVATLAQERHVAITSLVTLPAAEAGAPRRVVLRIGTMLSRPFVTELVRAGIKVDAPDSRDG